jgi:hypothetical protein
MRRVTLLPFLSSGHHAKKHNATVKFRRKLCGTNERSDRADLTSSQRVSRGRQVRHAAKKLRVRAKGTGR